MKATTLWNIALALAAAAGSLACVSPAQAELIYGLTSTNSLISFDSGSVATVSTSVPITNTTEGEAIIDIDYFPASSTLYGIGASGTVYKLNPATGLATADIANAAVGTAVSIDFNPFANRLRIISLSGSDANRNYRLTLNDPAGGATTPGTLTDDGVIAYAGGDTRAGVTPNLVGSAYTNSFVGATSTTLYSIDNPNPSGQGFLVMHTGTPAFSTLTTVAGLSIPAAGIAQFDPVTNTGFDISGTSGVAYVSEDLSGSGLGQRLFTLNLTNGVLTPVDAGGGIIGTAGIVTSIAVVPEPGTVVFFAVGAGAMAVAGYRQRRARRHCEVRA